MIWIAINDNSRTFLTKEEYFIIYNLLVFGYEKALFLLPILPILHILCENISIKIQTIIQTIMVNQTMNSKLSKTLKVKIKKIIGYT